jgi:hypothetical protein
MGDKIKVDFGVNLSRIPESSEVNLLNLLYLLD